MQHTDHLLMIQPIHFGFNAETAVNNSFQQNSAENDVQEKALQEFNDFVKILTNHHIHVTVIQDTPLPHTPDSIFPNNWISFHENGTIGLYPMFATNRRQERKQSVLKILAQKFNIHRTIDLTHYEEKQLFLEGTGSMVLDRENRIAYACLSTRTNKTVLLDFCNQFNYTPVYFNALDEQQQPIYHTNVMMCVADEYAIICLDSIIDEEEMKKVIQSVESTKKTIIPISYEQLNHFAGNMLQVHNTKGERFLVMSSQAYSALTKDQIQKIEQYNSIIHANISTIETNGGGSARCMMAEVFLPVKLYSKT